MQPVVQLVQPQRTEESSALQALQPALPEDQKGMAGQQRPVPQAGGGPIPLRE
jgi:hypothetical protein